jgi:hypothetical protein
VSKTEFDVSTRILESISKTYLPIDALNIEPLEMDRMKRHLFNTNGYHWHTFSPFPHFCSTAIHETMEKGMRLANAPCCHLLWMILLLLLSLFSYLTAAANNHDIPTTLRNNVYSVSAKVYSPFTPQRRRRRRRLEQQDYENENQEEQNDDDDNQNDDNVVTNYEQQGGAAVESTFGDMFYTSPSTWSAAEWGVFAGLLTLFGVIFCCWCLVCVIPKCSRACCGDRAVPMMYAAMV